MTGDTDMLGTTVATAKTLSGVKAALVAVGVSVGASHMPTPPQVHGVPVVRGVPVKKAMTEMQGLRRMDHRLGVIEKVQKTMLRGYETGGVYG